MGGNGPFVVLDDADLDAAADAAVVACFLCAGQSCTAGERLLVHEAVREDFVARLAERVAANAQLGDPLADGTQMGPLNNEGVAAKMDAHVEDAVRRGATRRHRRRARGRLPDRPLLAGHGPRPRAGRRASPRSRRRSDRSRRWCRSTALDEAIELTNASPYGLLAAIYTGDLRKGLRFADAVHTGW